MGVQWEIKGPAYNNCSCDWGCPCQFNALPTHDYCRAVGAMNIERGHFGETDLSGLSFAMVFSWPGAVHMGEGSAEFFIDEQANEAQREALLTILSGKEAAEGMSVFQVFASTMETVHEPRYVPIECEVDVDGRTGRIRVPGLIESDGEPIRNQVTGAEQHVGVVMPGGFEYKQAHYGSGTSKCTGAVAIEFENSHAHWCTYHFNQDGIIG